MSSTKRNTPHLLRVTGLLALAFLLLLNGRGDTPTQHEQYAKIYTEQLEQDKQEAKLYGLALSELEEGKRRGLTPKQMLAVKSLEPQLTNEYKMALKSPEGASQLRATLRKAIANIDAASTPVTPNGNNLPASFTVLFFPKQGPDNMAPLAAVVNSGFMGLSPDNYLDQYTLRQAGLLINTAPEIVMPILQERAKVFPPTAADYILDLYLTVYMADNDYYRTPQGSPTDSTLVPPSRCAGLLTMAQARNPIYRLLAAGEAYKVETDETERLNFYSAYLNETDPYIMDLVINRVAETKTPAAISVLQSFQPAVQATGDAKLAARLQEQIQRLSK
jgi:hypothetical protein